MLAMFGTFALREKISAIYFYFRVLSREVTFAALHFVLRTLPVRLPLLSWIKVDNGGETRSKKQRRVTSKWDGTLKTWLFIQGYQYPTVQLQKTAVR